MNSVFSVLRRKRFKRTERDRGISLVELTIGVAILVIIIGITIFTVTQRGTTARMEAIATQIAATFQQMHAQREVTGSTTDITATTAAGQVNVLLTGMDDFATPNAVLVFTAAVNLDATNCGDAASIVRWIRPTPPLRHAGMDAEEVTALRAAVARAITNTLDRR